ncbi:MAG: DUF3298 domain-containing protein [Bacteroidia bacterium]
MKLIYIGALCSMLLILACKQETERSAGPQSQDSTIAIADSNARLESPTAETPNYDEQIVWEGTIDKYPIEMTLKITGEKVIGSYRYTSQENRLELKGELSAEGQYILTEYDSQANKTGLLKGEVEFEGRFTGSWMKPDSSGELMFAMFPKQVISHNINVYTPAKLRYDVNHIHKESPKGSCKIDIHYPYFYDFPAGVAERINAELMGPSDAEIAERLAECQSDDEPDGMGSAMSEGFRINAFVGPILSISYDFYAYFSGAAHGNYGSDTYNFDMRTGARLMPKDLFVEGYEAELGELIKQRMLEVYPEEFEYFSYGGVFAEQDYDLYADSISVYFDPYEIAPYAAGQIRVNLAYDEIKDLIRSDGPLALRP